MPSSQPGIAASRLRPEEYAANFSDIRPPLGPHQAVVEADRCYFCDDAPCMKACPTAIDVPLFIRQIQTGNPSCAAETILSQNILGGMCARACPTETLCEQACVREEAEGKPVRIGLLQRYATDHMMATNHGQPFKRARLTGKRIAVVGGGPAGLAAAHRLAMHGHDVVIHDPRSKLGGLNEYGIAAYKTPGGFAQAEVDFILSIGGITVRHGQALGRDVTLAGLQADYDAVFLAIGLAGVNALGVAAEHLPGVDDAVAWIAVLRQAADLSALPVGRRIVVIGGGMTAIDVATQSKRLGAEEVTIVYRRAPGKMGASGHEQELARIGGVAIRHNARPVRLIVGDGRVAGVEFERTTETDGALAGTGECFTLPSDMVFRAIGQTLVPVGLTGTADKIALVGGKIAVDGERRTSLSGVWAGGDCAATGDDLTVIAAADGRIAADSIDRTLGA